MRISRLSTLYILLIADFLIVLCLTFVRGSDNIYTSMIQKHSTYPERGVCEYDDMLSQKKTNRTTGEKSVEKLQS